MMGSLAVNPASLCISRIFGARLIDNAATRSPRLLTVSLAGLVTLGWMLTGEASEPAKHTIHLPTDWTHRHLIFSRPGTAAQAARVSEDLRYWQQVYRREVTLMLPAGEADPIASRRKGSRPSLAQEDLASKIGLPQTIVKSPFHSLTLTGD